MTRSNARELALHLIYAMQCNGQSAQEVLEERLQEGYYSSLAEENELYAGMPDDKQRAYICAVLTGVEDKRTELESVIERYSMGWSVNRISKLAVAIMELAIYEALYVDDVPCNVAIHEAVLLAQRYEEEETVSFINGILGSFSRQPEQPLPETVSSEEEPVEADKE